MATYQGTPGNDIIDGPKSAGANDWIDGLAGDDTVTLGAGQLFVSGPGNDKVTGTNGHGGYGLWFATAPAYVDLAKGTADDGFGGHDTLAGIDTVHMTSQGGTVIGTGAAEQVFLFGGSNTIDLAGGQDRVWYYEKQSADYTLTAVAGGIEVKNHATGTVDTLRGVEEIAFSDKTIATAYLAAAVKAEYQYLAYGFRETTMIGSYVYAGVTYPAGLLAWTPQAVFQLDVNGDGNKDIIAPMNKGYASGLDARTPFLALTTVNGKLTLDPAINAQMPVTAGARRAAEIKLAADGTTAVVTVAHDAHDGKKADLELLRPVPGKLDASGLVPTLPQAPIGDRTHVVDAHSMATGDLNGDGRTDILVGDWNYPDGSYALLQQADGTFTVNRQAAYTAFTYNWPLVNPQAGEKQNLLIDLAIVDVNKDGYGDIVAGFGHGSTHSYIFMNDHGAFSVANKIALPDSVYGIDNQLHMKTLVADFDRDGNMDMAILRSRYEPYYGGNYLQILHNDGTGHYTDVTMANVDQPLLDAYGARLEWTDYWQLADINGDGAMDILGHRSIGPKTPLAYVNDGTGKFHVVEIAADAPEGVPISWGDFDKDGKLEYVTFGSSWEDAAGTASNNRFAVFELNTTFLAGTAVQGGTGADQITLHGAGATAFGKGGNDRIDGSAEIDTAIFAASRGGYTVMRNGTGFTVVDRSGAEGRDTLNSVEKLQFADGTVSVQYNDQVQALYVAYFGRAADAGGFNNFRDALVSLGAPATLQGMEAQYDTNTGLRNLIDSFGISQESKDLYGTGDSRTFITAIYHNVLNRDPDAGGLDYWAGLLDRGIMTKGRAALSIMAGALSNTTAQGLVDGALVVNKLAIASNFTLASDTQAEVAGYSGNAAAAAVRDMLSGVTSGTDVEGFQSTVETTLAKLVGVQTLALAA